MSDEKFNRLVRLCKELSQEVADLRKRVERLEERERKMDAWAKRGIEQLRAMEEEG